MKVHFSHRPASEIIEAADGATELWQSSFDCSAVRLEPWRQDERSAEPGRAFIDAETGRLYVVVPRQEGKDGPEIQVYQAP